MSSNNRGTMKPLRKRIEQCIRKFGFDENFLRACIFHLEKIQLQFKPSEIKSQKVYNKLLMSNLFIYMMECYPPKRFQCLINEYSGWPVQLVPSEVFDMNEIPVALRKYVFFQCLQIGDVLDCRVFSSLPFEYQLRVIHKYGVPRILDDLSIIATMRKADIKELPQSLKEFHLCSLIRVVVTEIEAEERKVFVSVIDNNTDIRALRTQLGVIPDTNLPEYVLDPTKWDELIYRDYLSSSRAFYDPVLLNGIYGGFGINPIGTYSCIPIDKSLNSLDVAAELNELKLCDTLDLKQNAVEERDAGNLKKALDLINQAINIFPKAFSKREKRVLSDLHVIKATIHISEDKPLMSKKGFEELVNAYNIDITNEAAKVGVSKGMLLIALKYYKQQEYKEAVEWASRSLKLYEDATARSLMEHLELRHPLETIDCEEISLLVLLEKKKALGSALKRLSGEDIEPLVPY